MEGVDVVVVVQVNIFSTIIGGPFLGEFSRLVSDPKDMVVVLG